MPKVHTVKSARKPIPAHGINVGDTYYWWSFRVGRGSVKKISKNFPKPSQLTNSEFLSQFLEFEESAQAEADNLRKSGDNCEAIAESLENLASDVRALGDEQEEKRSAMEDAFPGGCPTMELLEQRYNRCEEVADELETVASNIRDAEPEEEECYECGGCGSIDEDCHDCDGQGEVEGESCGECDGEGTLGRDCPDCAGTGKLTASGFTEFQLDELASEIESIDWCVE